MTEDELNNIAQIKDDINEAINQVFAKHLLINDCSGDIDPCDASLLASTIETQAQILEGMIKTNKMAVQHYQINVYATSIETAIEKIKNTDNLCFETIYKASVV